MGFVSKYDGIGIKKYGRPPAKVVIVLDISGSMSGYMETVRTTLLNMLSKLRPDDYFGIVLFDNVAEVLQDM